MTERRSLMQFVRDAARRARNIKKLTDPHAIAGYCFDEAKGYGLITAAWTHEAELQSILRLVTFRKKPPHLSEDAHQLRLFIDHEDIVFDIRHDDAVVQKALADCGLSDIAQIERQKGDNIAAAEAERDLFARASSYIKPLLESHPGWVWRDAVSHLSTHGGLPSL
ncbi:hypothetical protein HAP48_0035190 [Bradyrhizobium septentrionale]|uniref:Uncharacterized protein n=1 Tax=Bradyrhizobium septentrionale TaxID=1404411 RepID=A0A973W014_9BRAD|nr:hypothetical protein [Bradyrhizobium septentrionale]UGY13780.1 hypothetical protein HAP48_0035190 [Bradyrhizobium septentrionale]